MRAEIKRLHSPDIEDLPGFVPEDRRNFGFLLQVMAGPKGGEGEASFDIQVCTPRWLEQNHGPNDIVLGRHLLIVLGYDYARISSFLESQIDKCDGETWNEVATKIGKIGAWEFEDYTP